MPWSAWARCSSAATHAPLMSILMIFEMTLSYEAMLPLMLACVTGFAIARALRPESMYSRALGRNPRAQAMLGASLPKGGA